MKFKIKKETVIVEEKTVEITLTKSANDVCLKVGPFYIFSIKNDGMGQLHGGLEDNELSLQTDKAGKILLEK